MSVYPERRNGRLSGEWIAEITHVGVRVRKRFDIKHEADRWADGTKATGAQPQVEPEKPALFVASVSKQDSRNMNQMDQSSKKHRAAHSKLSPAAVKYRRGLPDDDLSAVKKLAGALKVFSNETATMPMQYVESFLLVAEEEGLGVTDYAKRAGIRCPSCRVTCWILENVTAKWGLGSTG
jgi:hypothetical protein